MTNSDQKSRAAAEDSPRGGEQAPSGEQCVTRDERRVSRRQFVAATAALSGVTLVPRHVLGGRGFTAPSDTLNIAGIGAGGQALSDLREFEGENIVALADVDDARGAEGFAKYPNAKRYRDYRKMLDEDKSIDAVVIAIPDHSHAAATMAAIRHGKHVYCEKPLTRTVHEARAVANAAREAKVATQMGNQGMAFEGNRLIKEWLGDGAIGKVREVHVWSDRPTQHAVDGSRLPQLMWAQGIDAPLDQPPVPPTLDWDLWLGPAPYRPYHPAYVPFAWRGWWDFGSGGLGDMGVHNLAPVFSALKLGPPLVIESSSTLPTRDSLPLASRVHYHFGARGKMPPVTVHWYDGGILPARPDELEPDRKLSGEDGIIFAGDKGTMLVAGWGGETPRLIPEKRMRDYKRPRKTLPRSEGHYKEWVRACKEGTPTESNFDFAGSLTEALLLGTISVRLGGARLEWDSAAMRVTNVKEGNDYLHYEYRTGWSL